MALTLQYCRTFIDAQEGAANVQKPRSSSTPPCLGRQSWDTNARREEEALRTYVTSLTTNVTDLRPGKDPRAGEEYPPPKPEEQAAAPTLGEVTDCFLFPSKGSVGHPELCHRPCIYFASGHCENGRACGYCHMGHQEKPIKLDKQQRAMVHSLSEPQVLAIMLRYLKPIATRQGFELQAAEVVQLVEREFALHGQPADEALAEIPEKVMKKLSKTLDRMRFSGILGLASQEQIGYPFRQHMIEALERLRAAASTHDLTEHK
mmetsp:Transcript_70329/g.164778  ORF Transcript_70329/g.164778 Transcript_70329/m.164778 type:complete len:262 (+) Transcript_70329:67-852(+)